jgi:hypothetical protein
VGVTATARGGLPWKGPIELRSDSTVKVGAPPPLTPPHKGEGGTGAGAHHLHNRTSTKKPSGAARTLLRVMEQEPEAVLRVLGSK